MRVRSVNIQEADQPAACESGYNVVLYRVAIQYGLTPSQDGGGAVPYRTR